MNPLNIAFYWHMHQPSYKDPVTKRYVLPWVRMNGIKGYFDMVSLLEDFPNIHQTFNLVPSLLAQLREYAEGRASDIFLDHTLKPASELSPREKGFILTGFFMANWGTMIQPYKRYWDLLRKRGMKSPKDDELDYLIKGFSAQEYLDLQVWFNLTWFGYRAIKKKEGLKELKEKGRLFTEEEKRYVIAMQAEIIEEIIPLYKQLEERGQIELTTSPFYHPILPLLYDTDCAKQCMPGAILPERFHHSEDAEAQINRAIELHKELFGKKPAGLWPSEGSVSPELIPILKNHGIKWIATDEGILINSLHNNSRINLLYQPYTVRKGESEINIVFRDRQISDLIGFTYCMNSPEDSMNDFMNRLNEIQRDISDTKKPPLVSIILDGENPWENYPDGGESFLTLLYQKLSEDSGYKTVRISEHIEGFPPERVIENLYPGSWINHNFKIWIGSDEDNKGWDYLKRTRDFLSEYIKNNKGIPDDKIKSAWEEIYVAEGSDWFWWYGNDFSSENDDDFDHLFRAHLKEVYNIMNVDLPAHLNIPITTIEEDRSYSEPMNFISPRIDGINTSYFEWLGAGCYIVKTVGTSMYRGEWYISRIYYGFNLENIFIRLDRSEGEEEIEIEGVEVAFHILNKREYKIIFPYRFREEEKRTFILYKRDDSTEYRKIKEFDTIEINSIIEFSVPFKELGLESGEEISFGIELRKGGREIDRYPRHRYISFTVPDEDFENTMWSV